MFFVYLFAGIAIFFFLKSIYHANNLSQSLIKRRQVPIQANEEKGFNKKQKKLFQSQQILSHNDKCQGNSINSESSQQKNKVTKNDDCYLIKSGIFSNEQLKEDQPEIFYELLSDNKSKKEIGPSVNNFLIPYNISFYKFMFNSEYYNDPNPLDNNNCSHIAPSLKIIKQNPLDFTVGFPNWFFYAFPDVAVWALKGEGYDIIEQVFKDYSQNELLIDNYLKDSVLKKTIECYLTETNIELECKRFSF